MEFEVQRRQHGTVKQPSMDWFIPCITPTRFCGKVFDIRVVNFGRLNEPVEIESIYGPWNFWILREKCGLGFFMMIL